MKRLVKRPMTLIEMIVALALTVIVLTTLTFFYRQVSEIDAQTEKVISDNFQLRYAETRLAEILPRTISASNQKHDFVFFSIEGDGLAKPGSQSLIFTFDNQISLDKMFSNHVIGRIYLDTKGNLTLAYWPSPKRWERNHLPPMKKEILLENVDNLAFEFYIAPVKEIAAEPKDDKKTSKGDKSPPPSPEPKGAWRKLPWQVEFQQLPAMIRVMVTLPKREKPMVFAFPLPNAKSHVIYGM